MATLTDDRILNLLQPFAPAGSPFADRLPYLATKFSMYLDLLLRWNARTNLTAIRNPEEIIQRHFGESVVAAGMLQAHVDPAGTLLDFGSGAGFPGLPIQLCHPELNVCLAESQGKKAAFLREAVRMLALRTEVFAARVEAMPAERRFAVVTMRAVDSMAEAMASAAKRVAEGGKLVVLSGEGMVDGGWNVVAKQAVPLSEKRLLTVFAPNIPKH